MSSQTELPIIEPAASAVAPLVFPLSYSQERLWFLQQFDPNNSTYNHAFAVRLKGELNVEVLRRSLCEIFRRHEMLRTVFQSINGSPLQYVLPDFPLALKLEEIQAETAGQQEKRIAELAEEEARRPFDLTTLPLLRVRLLQVSQAEHVLIVNIHHIIFDAWSGGILWGELGILYEAYRKDEPSPLEELPIQYGDYAVSQREWLQGEILANQLQYWKTKLADLPEGLNLPFDRPRPAAQSFRGGVEVLAIPDGSWQELKRIAQSESSTLFVALLAAFEVLMMRYSQQEDFAIAVPVANRGQEEIQGLIGFFVNTLLMRADVHGNPTFRELLRRVRETSLNAFAYQDVPFEKVVEELHLQRNLSSASPFQVLFTFLNTPAASLEGFGGLQIVPHKIETGTSKCDLVITLGEGPRGPALELNYNTDLFDPATIRRMLQHYGHLLAGMAQDPEQRIWELSLLGGEEVEELRNWNRTRREYPRDATVKELFEQQVGKWGSAAAAVCGEEQLTYNELNRRANRLAHYLQKLGVKEETRVGLCAGRNLAMLVGILGIVKAGGAYVPFDVEYPRERLEYMVKDAGVEVLVTDVNEQQQQMRGIGPPVVCLELEREEIERESEENPEQGTGAENLLYVMYTSGSTGRPKGVAVTHRNVVRLVKNSNYAEFSEREVVLQNAPISFDAATMEIWGTLLNGAKLVVYGAEKGSLQDLVQQIREFGVTTVWLTAGLFHLLVESGLEKLTGLRQLMAGGDVLSVQAVKKVLDKLPACRMINGYGPTEGTTFTCCYGMGPTEEIGMTVPIGGPIANTRVYVLDEEMGRVPAGVAGELYIGGDGVARGYWRRPELTAEKFVPNPFVAEDGDGGGHEEGLKRGERVYRTGDRVRWLKGGRLEFLGRMDHQVKVRGYRVEPGEIEATLREHEGVQECAVLVRGEGAAEKKLVAYVAGEATMKELREHLQRKLPEYMVPVVIVVMAEMPLNANGKVDRGVLLAMEVAQPQLEGGYKAPRTMLEELLAEIWAEVLNIERVGIHDNFFDLGGHSLLATQVMSRVKEVFHVDAPLRSLFEFPTVAELAVQIAVFGNASSQEPGQTRIQTRPRGPDSELPLSYAQERLWFLDHLQPKSDLYNVGVSFAFKGEIDATIMTRALQEIVRRHEVLRTCFLTKSGTPVLEIEEAVEIRVPVVDLTEFEPETRAEHARQIAFEHQRKPFILAKPPLINCVLIKLGTGEYILSLAMHHIVTDEWSLGILGRELSALYEAFSRGEKSPLQELAIQYVDYAAWQREWLKGDVLVEQMLYWKNQLKDMPGVLDLPVDRPRPPMPSFRGQIISKSLSPELLNDLKRLGRSENATLFMTLLAAYQVLLMRYSCQEDFGVGTPVANRRHVETEGLIGFFVNTLVMRADLTKHPTFRELLQRVRQSALEAYAHQDLPFEKLVEELQPERNTGRAPLFQTIFVFQHASVTTETSELEQAVAVKYDLDLTAGESNKCLVISLNYSTDLFEPARGRQMLEHYERLLHAVVREPKVCVGELPMLTERERLQISEWNATRVEYERDACIHQLFEAQVELLPNDCAVVYEDHRLTYRELNRRANQLAHYLIRRGVGPDARVGLLMPRRPEMIVGILGILKSGGAYVPLDPNYPFERLRHMIKDAEVTALLALDALDRNLAENLPGVIYLRDESAQIDKESDANPAMAAMPENLAYVIYTSGSTGVPKGVAITHRNFCHLHKSQQVNFRVRPGESVLQFFSMSFDAAVSEWSMALLAGARLVLSEPTVLMEGKLGSVLKTQEIDTVTLTPSVLQLLGPDNLPKLRTLIVAGESCPEELVLKWGHGRRFLNAYGPTEVTVCATVSGELRGPGKPPIGRPITNAHAYVLDNHMQLCACGVVGELYVGGAGLARGYWKKPSLTAEKFIPDPFSNEVGQRLYRTGDLVKYREDGNLEFLGRADRQLKLRGFRIELGEIETLLRQQDGITDAVVIPDQQDGSMDMRLVAYVAASETRITVAELKSSLRKKLPEYMIPAAFVILPELPLNPNGKLDMRALPAPDACSREEQLVYTPCRTELEQSIAKIWQDLLQIEKVGLDDNFFDLGGHSLLVIRMRNEMQRLNNLDLSVVELFTYTTVRSLAEYITKRKEQTTLSVQFEQRALLQKAFMDRRREFMNKEGVQ